MKEAADLKCGAPHNLAQMLKTGGEIEVMRPRYRVLELFVVLVLVGSAQGSAGTGDWQGKLEVVSFSYGIAREGKPSGRSLTGILGPPFHESARQEYRYNVYQNARNVVRRDLTYAKPNRSIGGPTDVSLLDYNSGRVLAWNKRQSQAERGVFIPPVSPSRIGIRKILGHRCNGFRYHWQDSDGVEHTREVWTAADANFKDPLLEIRYGLKRDGTLEYLELRVMTRLEPASDLSKGMFHAPSGLQIRDIP
ncbi:MAG TPA: hypothetical protein VFZ08_03055 [Terriglobia bacterium]|nr:hypothetical protein [Terriglobia bacterium]